LFTTEELKAIFAGLRGLDSISEVSHTNSLSNKLSPKGDIFVSDTQPILVDLASHYKNTLTHKIEFIKSSIYESRCISFLYYYPKGEIMRIVEPYLLVFKWSSWYLLCYCLEKNDFRLFKLNRLWDLRHLEQRFQPKEIPGEVLNVDNYFTDEIVRHVSSISPRYR